MFVSFYAFDETYPYPIEIPAPGRLETDRFVIGFYVFKKFLGSCYK